MADFRKISDICYRHKTNGGEIRMSMHGWSIYRRGMRVGVRSTLLQAMKEVAGWSF